MKVFSLTPPAPSGTTLREQRLALDIGLEELARSLGVSRTTIWRAENETESSPRTRRLIALALDAYRERAA